MSQENYAIRFGLGAIKAVGLKMMEGVVEERKKNGDFSDIYDFAKRIDSKSVNKKSVEALAKAGAFDNILKNRRQIFESFDILSAYSSQQQEEATSDQMNFFGEMIAKDKAKPELKKVQQWDRDERLQREFEAFGFFLNEHPLDDKLGGLRRRGVVFCDKIEKDEFEDNDIVKMAGVVAFSKHRSSAKGRFAYMSVSDPFGIYEVMVFDEALITNCRDIMVDGSQIFMECAVRKDEGGIRVLIRNIQALADFIKSVKESDEPFEDIVKGKKRRNYNPDNVVREGGDKDFGGGLKKFVKKESSGDVYRKRIEDLKEKRVYEEVEIFISNRDAIFGVKAFLGGKVAPSGFEKYTKVVLGVFDVNGDVAGKVALPEKYLLDEGDANRVKGVLGVEKVVVG